MTVRKKLFTFITAACICLFTSNTFTQTSEYKVKAIFIFKIVQYIEWPKETTMRDRTKPFIISVLGRNPFGTILEDIFLVRGQKIKNRKVKIRYLNRINQLGQCHLLFVSGSMKKRINNILSHIKGKPVLIMGDTKSFGKKGVHINFYIWNKRVKFELNESATVAEGFSVNFRLRNIAKIVGSRKKDSR